MPPRISPLTRPSTRPRTDFHHEECFRMLSDLLRHAAFFRQLQ